jgi:SAM-dependent methyltransferase
VPATGDPGPSHAGAVEAQRGPKEPEPMKPRPGRYAEGHDESVLRSHTWRTANNSAAYLLPYLEPGMSLLDVGCGPGTITADLAALVSPGAVVAVDSEPDVLEHAEVHAVLSGYGDRITFAVGDVHALEYPDDTFDVVHAHEVLQHVDDPIQALREMKRVCKPGGIVAARDCDYDAFFWHPEIPALTEWVRLHTAVARASGGEPDAGRRLLSWAEQVGFTYVTPSAAAWWFADERTRAWWGGLWATRMIESDFARAAVEGGHATRADLARLAEGWTAWRDAPDGWLAIPHGEIIARV